MKKDLAVGAYIIHEDKLVLILHNKLGIWLPPGGHIEPNETPDQAVIREVKEEVNLDIKFLQYKRLYTGRNVREECALPFYTNVHSVGAHEHFGLFYLCKAKDITQLEGNLNEIGGIRFFSLESLALDFITEDIQAIGRYALELSKAQINI